MAHVHFVVRHSFDASPQRVWTELIDWPGHAEWIPATRVEVGPGDMAAVGAEFTAWTGVGPLSLKDHMRVSRCDWDEATKSGDCEVEKLGPVLAGTAGFTVEPEGAGAVLNWVEDVDVRYVPQLLAPIVAKIGAAGFSFGMRGLAKLIAKS